MKIHQQEKEIIELYKKLSASTFQQPKQEESKKCMQTQTAETPQSKNFYQEVQEELASLFSQVDKFREEKEKFVDKYKI